MTSNTHKKLSEPAHTGILYRLAASIRTGSWWQYKAAPLMGFVYIFIHINHIQLLDALIGTVASVVTIVGIAGLGYVINDVYDIPFDQAAGKVNRIAGLNFFQRALLIVVLLAAAFVPWLWLPYDGYTIGMIAFQFSLYLFYSHPFIRFKEKHFWGVICDALYGHAMPALIAMYTFHKIGQGHFFHFFTFMVISFVWLFFKGARNIIIHQIEDRKNDRSTGFKTFVLWYGPLSSFQLLNNVILPIEMFLACIWICLLALNLPLFAVIFCFFMLVEYFKFSGWKLEFLPYRQVWFKFVYFLNDLYEDWIPLMAVLYLPFADVRMVVFVAIHLLLFPGLVVRIAGDIKVAVKNIKQGVIDEHDRRSYFDW